MNKTDPNESAFPFVAGNRTDPSDRHVSEGLTKREYIATKVYATLISRGMPFAQASSQAVQATDELIVSLNKKA